MASLKTPLRFTAPADLKLPYNTQLPYPMMRKAGSFAAQKVSSWTEKGLVRLPTWADERERKLAGAFYPSFVKGKAGRSRLVVEYKRAHECVKTRTFRMDQLLDFARSFSAATISSKHT